ncbi:MAG TPA: hypothetical protein VFV11_09445 [Solimonas sp.]|nr:hypothetical protein [Solimonas sp.]
METRLFAALIAGLLAWQLASGQALDRSWRPRISREEQPGTYWLIVLFQAAVLGVVLLTGSTHWRF